MVHRVQAVAQFVELRKETNILTEAVYGLWLDHKQKMLPQRIREGLVEYFAKNGMSLLGFMLVRRVTRVNSDDGEVIGVT